MKKRASLWKKQPSSLDFNWPDWLWTFPIKNDPLLTPLVQRDLLIDSLPQVRVLCNSIGVWLMEGRVSSWAKNKFKNTKRKNDYRILRAVIWWIKTSPLQVASIMIVECGEGWNCCAKSMNRRNYCDPLSVFSPLPAVRFHLRRVDYAHRNPRGHCLHFVDYIRFQLIHCFLWSEISGMSPTTTTQSMIDR